MTPSTQEDSSPEINSEGQSSGPLLIGLMLGFSILASVAGWFYHYSTKNKIQDFWGIETTKIIARAEKMTFLKLQLSQEKQGKLILDETPLQIVWETKLPSLKESQNMRYALTQNRTYDFEHPPLKNHKPIWEYAFRFQQEAQEILILISIKDWQMKLCKNPGNPNQSLQTDPLRLAIANLFKPHLKKLIETLEKKQTQPTK